MIPKGENFSDQSKYTLRGSHPKGEHARKQEPQVVMGEIVRFQAWGRLQEFGPRKGDEWHWSKGEPYDQMFTLRGISKTSLQIGKSKVWFQLGSICIFQSSYVLALA